jgi:23S rRNA pseudouridine1911/1915/1917 synthase
MTATRAGGLFELLGEHFSGWGRNTLRERLRSGCVTVNGVLVVRHDAPVAAGDHIEVHEHAVAQVRPRGPSLPTLHLDDDLCAIDKPAGLLSVASDSERERTALRIVQEMLGELGTRAPLWPAHRIDRETSGVLLFARSREVCDRVQAAWADAEKVYAAIVEGVPEPPDGVVEQPLWEDKNLRVRVGNHPDAKPARTRYRTVATGRGRSRLDVELDTGRKHQIRAHLAWLGCPIVGDDRYGERGERLCLHAMSLTLPHPRDGRVLRLEAPVPKAFERALTAR